MNAMCDIAFLLFIFIMVISVFKETTPDQFEAAESQQAQEAVPVLELYIQEDGTVWCGGPVSDSQIVFLWQEKQASAEGAATALYAHKSCPYKYVDRVQSLLKEAGCSDFIFAVEKK